MGPPLSLFGSDDCRSDCVDRHSGVCCFGFWDLGLILCLVQQEHVALGAPGDVQGGKRGVRQGARPGVAFTGGKSEVLPCTWRRGPILLDPTTFRAVLVTNSPRNGLFHLRDKETLSRDLINTKSSTLKG